jgi:hypothetical protein
MLPLLLAVPPDASWGNEAAFQRLSGYYHELQEAAQHGPFGLPLQVHSEERPNLVSAEIRGIVDHPFEALGATFIQPGSWCDFLSLNPNIKACTFQEDAGGRPVVHRHEELPIARHPAANTGSS